MGLCCVTVYNLALYKLKPSLILKLIFMMSSFLKNIFKMF